MNSANLDLRAKTEALRGVLRPCAPSPRPILCREISPDGRFGSQR